MDVVTDKFWLSGKDESEIITYPEYPDYMQAVKPSCSNCQHITELKFTSDDYYCTNHDTKAFIEGGMVDKPLLKPSEWRCPLWKEKAEGE